MNYRHLLPPDKPSRGTVPPMLTGESAEHFERSNPVTQFMDGVGEVIAAIGEFFEVLLEERSEL